MQTETEYRVIRGSIPRRVYGAKLAAKQTVEREGHTLAVQTLTDVKATIPEGARHWAYEIRRGRMTVYGGVLRFLDLLHRRGCSKETALLIPSWIAWYVEEVWDDSPSKRPVSRALGVRRAA